MTQQDYSIDAIAAPAGSLLIGGELPPPSITFSTKDVNEIAKFTEDGFYYKGEFIDDAGEVHRLLKEVLGQMKTDLNPVDAMTTDQELLQFTEDWWRGFMVYEGEEGRAYASHVFNHVSKQHLIDFLRDALAELKTGTHSSL